MTYTLITANRNYSSWSLRPWVLMTMLGIPFKDRIEPFTADINYEAFRAFSPTGQVPVLLDGARTVWDSLGITLYLADRHEGVWPQDPAARAWAQCAVTEMHGGFSALRNDCTMNVGVRVKPKPMSGLDVGHAGQEWVHHILALPAMRAWEKDALTESWREAGHEAELQACGEIIADYRQA